MMARKISTLSLNQAEAIAKIDWPLVRLGDAPAAELAKHRSRRGIAVGALRVQRGEILREPLADPLLVVVLPADRLSPPLVRELVREEELRDACKRRRIVAPVTASRMVRRC